MARVETPSRPLPSESQRIPCSSPSEGWQLLDAPAAAQKTVATVSMIDCLWEKLTKVSDEVESLLLWRDRDSREERDPAVAESHPQLEELAKVCGALQADLQAHGERTQATEQQLRGDHSELRSEMLRALNQELEGLKAFVEEGQHHVTLRKEIDQLKYAFEVGKEQSAMQQQEAQEQRSALRKDVEYLKHALEGQEQRLDQRLKTSMEACELSQSTALERSRLTLRQQMQEDLDRQEQQLGQMKQRLVETRDEAFDGLHRLQKHMDLLEGEQGRFSRSSEELRQKLETAQEDTRKCFEARDGRLQAADAGIKQIVDQQSLLEKQLQAQQQEWALRCESMSQEIGEKFDRALQLLQEKGQELSQQSKQLVCNLREELGGQLQDLGDREVAQRQSLEERSNQLLDLGLQKLAKEVAERIDRQQEQQRLALLSAENRLSGHLESCYQRLGAQESWRSTFQEREAGRESYVKRVAEQLQRLEATCKEIPVLQSRIEEVRQSVKEDMAASAMNAFQGEMRLWAKMAQLGVAPPS